MELVVFVRGIAIIFSISLLFLQGFLGLKLFSTAARAGDKVTLAVGSVETITKSNTTLMCMSDNTGVTFPFPISCLHAIVPLYPDQPTKTWNNSSSIAIDVQATATFAVYSSKVNGDNKALEILPNVGEPANFSHKNYISMVIKYG